MPPAGAGDGAEDGGGAPAAFVADEQAVLAAQHDPLHLLLGEIVVDRDGAVGGEDVSGFHWLSA